MPTRVPLQHTAPSFVADGSWVFITICCELRGVTQLTLPAVGRKLLIDAVHYHRAERWRLHLFLLMPDHLHAIVAVGRTGRLAEAIRNWKRLTARVHGVRWQRNFFDHRLRAGESLEAKARYVRENPLRAGLVSRVEEWPFFVDVNTLEAWECERGS